MFQHCIQNSIFKRIYANSAFLIPGKFYTKAFFSHLLRSLEVT